MLQNTPEQFAQQLRDGHFNELRVALYFMLQGAFVRIGYTGQSYDLHVLPPAGRSFSVEVKWDKRAKDTGNLYFEIENTHRQQPSGITATQADYWCHVLGDGQEALLAPVHQLKALLRSRHFRTITTHAADSNSRGLLVPIAWLQTQSGIVWIELPTVEAFFGKLFRDTHPRSQL